jgi:hypothetical protein
MTRDVPDDLLADSCCLAAIFAVPRVLLRLLIPGVWAAAHGSPTADQSVQAGHVPDGTGPAHTPGPPHHKELAT